MLYDGIAAERAHVSIAGRSTASIIDEKSSQNGRGRTLSFDKFPNLARLERDMPALDGTRLTQHLAAF